MHARAIALAAGPVEYSVRDRHDAGLRSVGAWREGQRMIDGHCDLDAESVEDQRGVPHVASVKSP